MLSETHEKYQIIVARTMMYTVAKAFILHIRNLTNIVCFQKTLKFLEITWIMHVSWANKYLGSSKRILQYYLIILLKNWRKTV